MPFEVKNRKKCFKNCLQIEKRVPESHRIEHSKKKKNVDALISEP